VLWLPQCCSRPALNEARKCKPRFASLEFPGSKWPALLRGLLFQLQTNAMQLCLWYFTGLKKAAENPQ